MPGHNSSEVYRNVLERAKDLLTTLHVRVLEAEAMLQHRQVLLGQDIHQWDDCNRERGGCSEPAEASLIQVIFLIHQSTKINFFKNWMLGCAEVCQI